MENKLLKKYSGYFKIEKYRQDSRVVIFLICLLIATVLWFLNALGKNYTTQINYPVKYVNYAQTTVSSERLARPVYVKS